MAFENRRWLVIPTSIIENINFDQVNESGIEHLRKSVDGSKTFVKYEINVVAETYTVDYIDPDTGEAGVNTIEAGTYGRPSVYSTDYTEYNHEDILALLKTAEWSADNLT